ncbi:hypothetical protein [Streptomyces sp. NPDC003832]
MSGTGIRDEQLNRLWGAVCAFAGTFFLLWALSWINASVLNEDLHNRCDDLHTSSFPFEKSCRQVDGTTLGGNHALFEGLFFGSLAGAVACLALVLMIEDSRRRR